MAIGSLINIVYLPQLKYPGISFGRQIGGWLFTTYLDQQCTHTYHHQSVSTTPILPSETFYIRFNNPLKTCSNEHVVYT